MTSLTRWLRTITAASFLYIGFAALAQAQSMHVLDAGAARYLALGDSVASGYKAGTRDAGLPLPALSGRRVRPPHMLVCIAAVPGARNTDVLLHQVPQALISPRAGGFNPKYITLTVGGNDLLAIARYAAVQPDRAAVADFARRVLARYSGNLFAILSQLCGGLPDTNIFVSNQYSIPAIEEAMPSAAEIVAAFNNSVAQVVAAFPTNVYVVDLHSALAERTGLLLVERHGASPQEVHVTTAGHRVIADAFADVVAQYR